MLTYADALHMLRKAAYQARRNGNEAKYRELMRDWERLNRERKDGK